MPFQILDIHVEDMDLARAHLTKMNTSGNVELPVTLQNIFIFPKEE